MDEGYIRRNVCLDKESIDQLDTICSKRKDSGYYSKAACTNSNVIREAIRFMYLFECEHCNILHPGQAES